jgi:hypothetical protein
MKICLVIAVAKGLDTIIPLVIFAAMFGMIVKYWTKLWNLDDEKDDD